MVANNEELILTPLKNAIASLKKAATQPKDEFIRDAVIQRFKYTYELSWKFLNRYLSSEVGADKSHIKNILRIAANNQLIENLDNWFEYHAARTSASNTYNESIAEETYSVAKTFANDAEKLLTKLETIYARSY